MPSSFSLGAGAFEHIGDALGFFAQPGNLMRPDFWRLFRDLLRFYREAPQLADRHNIDLPTA
ncbi:MAG: hypothetical protein P8Z76_21080 [Alphaproteobacteria bacterium]